MLKVAGWGWLACAAQNVYNGYQAGTRASVGCRQPLAHTPPAASFLLHSSLPLTARVLHVPSRPTPSPVTWRPPMLWARLCWRGCACGRATSED